MYNIIQNVRLTILEAGEIALSNFNKIKCIEQKDDSSLVSNVDREIDEFIAKRLTKLTPDIPVISEEGFHLDLGQDKFWLVDPIDGTKSYINQQETYTVNIALIDYYKPVLGFIYIPAKDLLYYTDDRGSLIVEDRGLMFCIKDCTSKNSNLTAAVSSLYNKNVNKFVADYNISQVISIPSSIKLCMVADGSVDMYPRFGTTMEWDVAAGHALIKAVGGEVFCDKGQPLIYGKKGFINPNFIACSKHTLNQNILFDRNLF
ncbi:MAG: 3(2),5-bisphosphate nucleotidase [Rickettsiaceae bacterium]|jgi:3'(2'), 5'-bisphosphate nucleotidase|nr:3(2),5-bisphosphate nucleotidase [Rickettsiaceae bacterium]